MDADGLRSARRFPESADVDQDEKDPVMSRGSIMRVGIIGLGGAARQMLPSFLAHPQVRIVAVADPRPEARESFCAEFPSLGFSRAEDLCNCPEVDVVYIATPHQMHCEHAIIAASAGKHLIVEKPMALTLEECDRMIDAADRAGVHLLVGHTHSFNAPIRLMRSLIAKGEIGPLAMVNTWNYGSFLYRPRRPEELQTSLGGGILYNQAPHQIDVVRYLVDSPVSHVRAQAWVHDKDRPTEGSMTCFLQFQSGAVATLVYSGYDYFDTDEFHFGLDELGRPKQILHGSARSALRKGQAPAKGVGAWSRGAISPGEVGHPHFGICIASGPLGDLRQSADGVYLYGRDGLQEFPMEPPKCLPDKTGIVEEMYEAFLGEKPVFHDGRWGRATMEVCLAIMTSSARSEEVRLIGGR